MTASGSNRLGFSLLLVALLSLHSLNAFSLKKTGEFVTNALIGGLPVRVPPEQEQSPEIQVLPEAPTKSILKKPKDFGWESPEESEQTVKKHVKFGVKEISVVERLPPAAFNPTLDPIKFSGSKSAEVITLVEKMAGLLSRNDKKIAKVILPYKLNEDGHPYHANAVFLVLMNLSNGEFHPESVWQQSIKILTKLNQVKRSLFSEQLYLSEDESFDAAKFAEYVLEKHEIQHAKAIISFVKLCLKGH